MLKIQDPEQICQKIDKFIRFGQMIQYEPLKGDVPDNHKEVSLKCRLY